MDGWPEFLARFHAARPGITEQVLTRVHGKGPETPYEWLVESLRQSRGPILDLACGSAPTRDLLPYVRWLGVDASAAELGAALSAGRAPLARARADALPLADACVGAVCVAMCLQVLTPLDAVLGELRRVLRTGGTIAALVPSRLGVSPVGFAAWLPVMRTLGPRALRWPNPQARDGLAKLLRANGFAVDSDERRVYSLDIADEHDAALVVDSLYLPGVGPDRITEAKHRLGARTGFRLPVPLRRVVAHVLDTAAR